MSEKNNSDQLGQRQAKNDQKGNDSPRIDMCDSGTDYFCKETVGLWRRANEAGVSLQTQYLRERRRAWLEQPREQI